MTSVSKLIKLKEISMDIKTQEKEFLEFQKNYRKNFKEAAEALEKVLRFAYSLKMYFYEIFAKIYKLCELFASEESKTLKNQWFKKYSVHVEHYKDKEGITHDILHIPFMGLVLKEDKEALIEMQTKLSDSFSTLIPTIQWVDYNGTSIFNGPKVLTHDEEMRKKYFNMMSSVGLELVIYKDRNVFMN